MLDMSFPNKGCYKGRGNDETFLWQNNLQKTNPTNIKYRCKRVYNFKFTVKMVVRCFSDT